MRPSHTDVLQGRHIPAVREWDNAQRRAASSARKDSDRQIVASLAESWLHSLSATVPNIITGSDADIRGLALRLADVILAARS